MTAILDEVIARSRAGEAAAIPSVCSAHPGVIEASLRLARQLGRRVVMEATSNPVKQEGGYTGQRPVYFVILVNALANKVGLDRAQVALGGAHLGPQARRFLPADPETAKADAMVRAYAEAGYTKLHLDCSEGCAGEPAQFSDAQTVPRAAIEAAGAESILFVVGTEVPPPGGARAGEHGIAHTAPQAGCATLDAHVEAFRNLGRIGGLVLEPGGGVRGHGGPPPADGPRPRAPGRRGPPRRRGARGPLHRLPAPRVFARLAWLGFAFQKVGSGLTFAWSEAIYALDRLAQVAGWTQGDLPETMERVMPADPGYRQRHLDPRAGDLRLQRHFSYADRIRYYWPRSEVQVAFARLREALDGQRLPDPMLRQGFAPAILDRAEALRAELPAADARLQAAVQEALAPYYSEARA